MVKKLADNLSIPVFCKIRILPEKERTMALVEGIQKAGCWLLTVHGRTKEQNKHLVGPCDWETIKEIKEKLRIPVFANGGIHKFEDVERCLKETGVDGVMSAESLLENPALFSGKVHDLDDLAIEYIELWKKYDHQTPKYLKPHLFKMLHKGLMDHVDLREKLGAAKGPDECAKVAFELKERRKEVEKENKFGWYERYQNYAPQQNEKKKDETTKDGEEQGMIENAEKPNKKLKITSKKNEVESV